MPDKKQSATQPLPPAAYGPVFRFDISKRDVTFTFAQPTGDNKSLNLVSRVAMPIEAARELVDMLGDKLSKKVPTGK